MQLKGSDASAGQPVAVIGCGFIGRRMVEMLTGYGNTVTALTLSEPGPEFRAVAARVIVGDASDRTVLGDAVGEVDHVIWCAGGLMPREAEADPEADRDRTLLPLEQLVSLGPALHGKSVTYISSGGTVYGNPGHRPVSEDHPTEPVGAYGRNKLLAERLLADAATQGIFKLRVLRCSNVYGPNQPSDRGQGAVAVFADRIKRDLPIEIFGDGSAVRDYVHVDDVVSAAAELWDKDGPVVLNCGSGRPTTIIDLIEVLELAYGRKAKITRLPGRDFDVTGVVLEITRISELIEFDPVDLPTGLGIGQRLGAA